ncbi:precorrin-2 C(20)-methyltransferase [Helicovermis profundi]|uniref:Cobalt-factor II C(20)-methyltransferase n=1 Tax=Helicovermis profundi TaxID=3065157 RepID=A0AAU9E926_9FIRM|nr:cobalt-factor II C(20)-methyltransferase [Clostridia bacterium S502]
MKIYGIGVGPGDKEYLTVKAARILSECDILYCPIKSEGSVSFAYEIIKEYVNPNAKIVNLVFPMNYDKDELNKKWKENAKFIADNTVKNKKIAFIVIGDVMLYSTFLYLKEHLIEEKIDIDFIPGITSFSAISSSLGTPLAMWEEGLAVIPASKDSKFDLNKVLEAFDNVIVMKPSHNPKKIVDSLIKNNLENNFRLITKAGTDEEVIISDIDKIKDKIPYLSTMIIKKNGMNI